MAAHEHRFGREKAQLWSSALTHVSYLRGWHFKTRYEPEYELVQSIVGWVTKTRYNVFLSFSEKDTRYSFTGFLCDALCKRGFFIHMKEDGMDDEDQISQSLVTAIENSRLSIIVFFLVDPSNVRHKKESYGEAMTKFENKFGKDSDKIHEIRSALFEVTNLKGWHLTISEEDTRLSFTGHLYNALCQKRIRTYMQTTRFNVGDRIPLSLETILGKTRIAIVVFSENFAHSCYCLDELLIIVDCKKSRGQLVLPIFYNVDPSDVRHLRGKYGEAMTAHELKKNRKKVEKWSLALSEVANLAEWQFDIRDGRNEYEFIQTIVERVTEIKPCYNVFLNFCGKDTRYSFTGFLYDFLCEQGFKTFMKEDEDQISQSLVAAIEKSRLSIIVFSENYAFSSSCLDELVTIHECMKTNYQQVWPIFYKVEPSDIRHQRGSYGKAMIELENKFGKDSEKVQKIRLALSEVANLKGWPLKSGYEYKLVEDIVRLAIRL